MTRPQMNKTEQVYWYIREHFGAGQPFYRSSIVSGLPHIAPGNISTALYNLREGHAVLDGEQDTSGHWLYSLAPDAPAPTFSVSRPEGLSRTERGRARSTGLRSIESRQERPDTFPEEQYASALFDLTSLWMEEMEALRSRIAELEDCPDLSLVPDSDLFAELQRRKSTGDWTRRIADARCASTGIDCNGTRR